MSADNEAKVDNLGLFYEVDKFETIEINKLGSKEYKLIPLKSDEIEYLKSIVETLEKDEDVYLCARGDSKKGEHADFINEQLYDFFIVGDKAKYHSAQPANQYQHTLSEREIIDDIKELLLKCNEVLENKSAGKFPDRFISDIENLHIKKKESWKFVLLAFLHNKGNDDYFKPYSGFASLTYGQGKYDTAKKFAIERNKKGVVYTYILKKDSKQYFKTEDMNQRLKKYDVEWYEDKHSEIMLLNGLFPHNVIGFFEIDKNSTKRFILNYWFHQQIKDDLCRKSNFDYKNGVEVLQENFQEAAIRRGYNSCFTCSHVFDMVNGDVKPTIEFDGGEDMNETDGDD